VGARRRGGSLRVLGGVLLAGGGGRGGGVVALRSPEKKLGAGEGARGLAGAAADRRWGVVSGRRGDGRPAVESCFRAARQRRWGIVSGRRGGAGFGRWWLVAQGVQVEDEPQALPKLSHVKCLSATIAFNFDSNIQIPQ